MKGIQIKYVMVLTFICLVNVLLTAAYGQVGFGQAEKINRDWKFALNDVDQVETSSFDDKNWLRVDLPHDWSVKGRLDSVLASCTGYLPGGIGWYRKRLEINSTHAGQKVYLYFEGVYNRSDVYINGHLLGHRPNGYISFMYDATPYIEFGKENIISVRVDHSRYADSRWYTGSGIYRNVWLVYANPLHLAQWGVFSFPQVKNDKYQLHIKTELENESRKEENLTVIQELFSPDGKTVATVKKELMVKAGQKGELSVDLPVQNPKLWDLATPHQYRLVTKVVHKGKLVDSSSVMTGFRNFQFDPNTGFSLNRKNIKMKGVCLHHDAGVLGAAVPKEVLKKRLMTLKEVGVNAIRTSHNPQSPDLYAVCDELGMLVLNEAFDEWEFPKRKWLEGWNVGKPGSDGNYDFFEQWGARDLADMVRRDRNHISIFAWSIGNEVDYPNDPYSHPILDGDGGFTQRSFGGYRKDAPDANRLGVIAKKLVGVVKQYDLSRPVTAGLAGVAMSNETAYPGALDIAGYNYTESRYISDHKKYPRRVIFGSENRHDYQAWKAVLDNEHIFGQFLWTGIDYLGESGKWPSRGFYSGLLDFAGNIKPRGYFRQALWSEKPMVYIGTYPIKGAPSGIAEDVLSQTENDRKRSERLSIDAWPVWNYKIGTTIRIVCYTNTQKAQLLLNGKKLGEPKGNDPATRIIYWDIPYQAGTLEVIGMDENNKAEARYAITTPQEAYAIQVIESDNKIEKIGGVAQIRLQIKDKDGIPVKNAMNEILCEIAGPGELLGLENGNNTDMGDYTNDRQQAYRGKLTAYVRSKAVSGTIKIKFSSKGLKSSIVSIAIKK
ncbi:hypothetical protein GCM10027051_27590 [Niabella terrae]